MALSRLLYLRVISFSRVEVKEKDLSQIILNEEMFNYQ